MIGSIDEGLAWLEQALTGYRALADAQNVATVTMEIGLIHLYAGNYRQSLPLFHARLDANGASFTTSPARHTC